MSNTPFKLYPHTIRRAYRSSSASSVYRQPYRYLRLVPSYIETGFVTVFPQTGTLTLQGQQPNLGIAVNSDRILHRIFRIRYYKRAVFRQEPKVIVRRYVVPYSAAKSIIAPVEATLVIQGQQPTLTIAGLTVFPTEGVLTLVGLQPTLTVNGANQAGPLAIFMRKAADRRIRAARYAGQYQRPWIMGARQVGMPLKPPVGRLVAVTEGTLTIQGQQPTFGSIAGVIASPTEGMLFIQGQQPTAGNITVSTIAEGSLALEGQTPTVTLGGFVAIGPNGAVLTIEGGQILLTGIETSRTPTEGVLAIEGGQVTIIAIGNWDAVAGASGAWSDVNPANGTWETTAGAGVTWN